MATKVAVKKSDAEKVLAAVKKAFKPWVSDLGADGESLVEKHGSYLPVLVKDYECYGGGVAPYAIVWEDGSPYDWPQLIPFGGIDEEFGFSVKAVKIPEGVFVEAISNIVLGIYEA